MHVDVVRERKRDREVRPGWWVAALRAEIGRREGQARPISQMRLAALCYRHVSAVARWESPDGELDFLTWAGLLAIAGLPLDWEPEGDGTKRDDDDAAGNDLDS